MPHGVIPSKKRRRIALSKKLYSTNEEVRETAKLKINDFQRLKRRKVLKDLSYKQRVIDPRKVLEMLAL